MEYINLQRATSFCSYSQEYLSLRARKGKLKAIKIGRNWHTTQEWLQDYILKSEDYRSFLQAKRLIPEIDPPLNLPIESSDADIWEDNRPEEVARQTAFLRKLQLATAFAIVIVLVGVSIFRGQQQVFEVAENLNPVVLSSAANLQQEVWEAGFAIGIQGREVGRVMHEYFEWLGVW